MIRSILTIFLLFSTQALADTRMLEPEDALQRASAGEITIIDIRLPVEWAETGLPKTAVGISLQDQKFQPRPDFVDDMRKQVGNDLDRPIALICARGNRSAFTRKLLAAHGFTQVYDITEGVVGGINGPGWLARDLPIEPCSSC